MVLSLPASAHGHLATANRDFIYPGRRQFLIGLEKKEGQTYSLPFFLLKPACLLLYPDNFLCPEFTTCRHLDEIDT